MSEKRSIYIASSWENRFALRATRDELVRRGHIVTSGWLDVGEVDYPAPEGARRDLLDILAADTLVFWPDDLAKKTSGKYVEFGMAVGFGLDVFIVEPSSSTCIFVQLDLENIHRVPSFDALYVALEQ